MSDTPRTDHETGDGVMSRYAPADCHYVPADFARDLERELAERTRERDEALRDAAQVRELMNVYNAGGWTDADRLMKERDALRAEVERLRKIAAHVPTREYIKAKEAAGFGTVIRAAALTPAEVTK